MRTVDFLGLTLACVAATAGAAQIPLRFPPASVHTEISETTDSSSNHAQWDLNTPPDVNSTGHLVFNTVSSLMQHWPNTRYRNGHTIVPGTIPTGTLLYHGARTSEIPTVPEWTATDPEHSYMFCRGERDTGCWHLTLVATRPLKVLYFDGTSAAKMQGGPMDSQDIVLWGKVQPDWTGKERERIDGLCAWGKQFALDGFARMEMDFEIMLCDFTAGVETLSFLNLASDRVSRRPPGPRLPDSPTDQLPLQPPSPNYTCLEPIERTAPAQSHDIGIAGISLDFEVVYAGSWHNRYPGDTRIKLDLHDLVSFYDLSLVPSLVGLRYGKERWDHRLEGLDGVDAIAVKKVIEQGLRDKSDRGSGIDWKTLLNVVVDRYADRLEFIKYLLDPGAPEIMGDELERAGKAWDQLRVMLTPYILHSAVPLNSTVKARATNHSWASPVFKQCATTHTAYISSPVFSANLTPSERLLLGAVQETTREICRVVVGMWAEGVINELDAVGRTGSAASVKGMKKLVRKWRSDVEILMAWLDWSVWVKCTPACGIEEMCYLPTWPIGLPRWPWGSRPLGETEMQPFRTQPEEDEWERPQPKCIRRTDPYGF